MEMPLMTWLNNAFNGLEVAPYDDSMPVSRYTYLSNTAVALDGMKRLNIKSPERAYLAVVEEHMTWLQAQPTNNSSQTEPVNKQVPCGSCGGGEVR